MSAAGRGRTVSWRIFPHTKTQLAADRRRPAFLRKDMSAIIRTIHKSNQPSMLILPITDKCSAFTDTGPERYCQNLSGLSVRKGRIMDGSRLCRKKETTR